jgi:transcriptional regulator with XRE-family HTH domain
MRDKKPISPAQRALGMAIRAERVKTAYSQERFARHAGIDRSYYGAIERGESTCASRPWCELPLASALAPGRSARRQK